MRHKFLVVTVKNSLKSVHIYRSYRKVKTGIRFFGPLCKMLFSCGYEVFVKGKSYAELGWFTSLNELVSTGYCVDRYSICLLYTSDAADE